MLTSRNSSSQRRKCLLPRVFIATQTAFGESKWRIAQHEPAISYRDYWGGDEAMVDVGCFAWLAAMTPFASNQETDSCTAWSGV